MNFCNFIFTKETLITSFHKECHNFLLTLRRKNRNRKITEIHRT